MNDATVHNLMHTSVTIASEIHNFSFPVQVFTNIISCNLAPIDYKGINRQNTANRH